MSDEDFKLSEVQLEFQSQPENSDNSTDSEEKNQNQSLTQENNTETLPDSLTQSQSQSELIEPRGESEFSETVTEPESESNLEAEDTDANFGEDFGQYDFNDLPEHACAYCGIHSPDSVVKCDDCDKWFCNSRGNTTGAHIINHLVRAKHKRVSLHKNTLFGTTTLECFNCGGKNVFLLGFIPAKSESIVVLLCREPCLTLNSLKEMNWDLSQWVPLIRDKMFLSWLVQIPSEKEQNRALEATSEQIRKIEEYWSQGNESATIRDLDQQDLDDLVEPVLVRYEDAGLYNKIYRPLINLESDYKKRALEISAQKGIEIRWDIGLNRRRLFYFRLSHNTESETRIMPGDELIITYPGDLVNKKWSAKGTVIKSTITDELMAELSSHKEAPTTQSHGFNIDFIWKPVPYERMKEALKTFAKDDYSVTGYLYHVLMGHQIQPKLITVDIPEDLSAPGLPKLNASQISAIKNSLEQPMSLIQGPPGTGKTVTSASLVYHLSNQRRGQILVCAPSNIGVDQLTAKIHSTGLKVVRLASRSREGIESFVSFLYLNELVTRLAKEEDNTLHKLNNLMERQGQLSHEDKRKRLVLVKKSEMALLQKADVICTTCISAGDPRLRNYRFKQVVVDESTQSMEPEVFIPFVKGAKQIILIGDHCQLGPIVMDKKAANAGLQRSLFERLIMLGIRPMRLQVQYRMHPCLSEFPSNTFYEGTLQNGVSVEDRKQKPGISFKWPNPNKPTFFYSSAGQEEFSSSGTSYLNRLEAVNVEKIVTKLLKSGVTPEQIGVVTPYEGQRQYIVGTMLRTGSLNKNWYEKLEVASVDAFQGREKDYIILSCVRSNDNLGIGFLSDPRRLNVALTRAKFGLVIVGNPKVLTKVSLWHSLLTHYKKNSLIVEGHLENLTECFTRFSEPKTRFERRRLYAEGDNEDLEFRRKQAISGGGLTGDNVVPDNLPTQYVYAHPNEIEPSKPNSFTVKEGRAVRLKAINRARNDKFPVRQIEEKYGKGNENLSATQSQEMSLSQESENFDMTFEQSLEDIFSQTMKQSFEDNSGNRVDLSGTQTIPTENEEFTQHNESQSVRGNEFDSQTEQDFNELSLGGYSQELNDMSLTELEEMKDDSM